MTEQMHRLLDHFMRVTPTILLGLSVAFGGLLASVVLRMVARWLARRIGLETLGERLDASKLLYPLGFKKGLADLVGQLVFVATLLLTAIGVAEVADLPGVAATVADVFAFLPSLIAAGAVLLLGIWLAGFLKRVVARIGRGHDDLDSPQLVAQVVYYLVIVVAVTLAADQAGIETELVESLVQITAVCLLASAGLSFAFAARSTFARVIARFYVQRMVRVGDRIKVGDCEGEVVAFAALAVVLQDGVIEHLVPYDRVVEGLERHRNAEEVE